MPLINKKRLIGAFFIVFYNAAMPSIETKIWMALKQRIETCLPEYKKAWPAVVSDIDASTPYIRVGKVQVAPQRIQIKPGQPHQRSGSLILTLVHPVKNGNSTAYYEELQGQIAAHFKDGTKMTYQDVCVSVPQYPHCVDGYLDAGWWNAPVSISWRCFA